MFIINIFLFYFKLPDLIIEIRSHNPKIAETKYPPIPITDIPYTLGSGFLLIIKDDATTIPAITNAKDNLLIILFNTSI